MPISHNEQQITWSSCASASAVTVTTGSTALSDVVTFSTNAVDAYIFMKADDTSTATTNDVVNFYIQLSGGDPDGSSDAEYDTESYGIFLASLNTGNEDPALASANCPVTKTAKIHVESTSADDSITVSATILETLVVT